MTNKPLSAEEMAREVFKQGISFPDGHGCVWEVREQEKIESAISKALLSFAQQESAPLVEALEFYSERKNMVQTAWIEQHGPDAGQECRKTSIIDYGEVAKKALQTHRLKYPKEKS